MTETAAGCDCPPRRAYGFTLTQHRSPCLWVPIGVCGDCGYDIVRGQGHEHELCAAA